MNCFFFFYVLVTIVVMVAQASKKYFTWKEDDVNCGNKTYILPFTVTIYSNNYC